MQDGHRATIEGLSGASPASTRGGEHLCRGQTGEFVINLSCPLTTTARRGEWSCGSARAAHSRRFVSIDGPAAKVIVWRERVSVIFAPVSPPQPPIIRIEPGSKTTAHHERPRDIIGPGENVMVSLSRISVVTRGGRAVVPTDYEHATLPWQQHSRAPEPLRLHAQAGRERHRSSVEHLRRDGVCTRLSTTTNGEDSASIEHDGCGAVAKREHLQSRLVHHRAKAEQLSRENVVKMFILATDDS